MRKLVHEPTVWRLGALLWTAASLAACVGSLGTAPTEEELLEAMQRVLNIDDALAHKVLEVLALKYAS